MAVDEILFANSSGDLHSRKKKKKKRSQRYACNVVVVYLMVAAPLRKEDQGYRERERRREATAVEDSFISLTNSDDG